MYRCFDPNVDPSQYLNQLKLIIIKNVDNNILIIILTAVKNTATLLYSIYNCIMLSIYYQRVLFFGAYQFFLLKNICIISLNINNYIQGYMKK